MDEEDDLTMAAMPPAAANNAGLAAVAADFEASMPRMLAESQQRREAAYKPLREMYQMAAQRLAGQRKQMPWHRVALAASEGMLAPMRYGGVGGAMSNIMQRVNPLIDQQEERSLRYDDQLRNLMMEQAKVDAEMGAEGAKAADRLTAQAWQLRRDANKTQHIQVKDPVTGEIRIVPTIGGVTPSADGAPVVVRGPEEVGALPPGTRWVAADDPQHIVRIK